MTWKDTCLEKIVSFRTGKLNSNAATPNGAFPFFTCSQEIFRTDTYSFDTECVLLGGNNASAIYPIKYFSGKFDAYQRTYVIEPLNRKSLNTKYLFYSLQLQLELMRRISTGVTTKFLTLGILNNIKLLLPPFETQKRIASILSAYDDLIENNTRRIKILEEMAQRIYKHWFVDFKFPGHEKTKFIYSPLGKIPEGWEVKRLGECIELAYGKALKNEDRKGGSIPVYGSSGIVGHHNQALVNGRCIIVGRKGNVGKVLWSEDDCYPIDTVFYVKTDVSLYYCYYNLRDQNFLNSDAAVPGLSRNQAYTLPFLLPTGETLNNFEMVMKLFFDEHSLIKKQNTNLRRMRDMLLPKLINGEIEV